MKQWKIFSMFPIARSKTAAATYHRRRAPGPRSMAIAWQMAVMCEGFARQRILGNIWVTDMEKPRLQIGAAPLVYNESDPWRNIGLGRNRDPLDNVK